MTIKAENASVQTGRLHVDTICGSLNENSPIGSYVNVCSAVDRTLWEGLRGVALLSKCDLVCY